MDEPACPGCRALLRRLEAAERRIADLEARLGQNASNSSLPPSANPPAAPQPVVKKPSGRAPAEPAEAALHGPRSPGAINRLERRTAAALAPAHAEALRAVRAAPVKHVDETGWKRAGGWLWLAATATVAAFVVHARRSAAGLTALLGEAIGGILCTDRWAVYDRLPPERRQVCWAHLKRDFQKCADRGGEAAGIGRAGLRVVTAVFACWHRHRDGPPDRDRLLEEIAPLARRLDRILSAGQRCADGPAATFWPNLLG